MNKDVNSVVTEGIVGAIKNIASNTVKKTVSNAKKNVANYASAGLYSKAKNAINSIKKADKKDNQKKPVSSGSLKQRANKNRIIKAVSAEQTIVDNNIITEADEPTNFKTRLNLVKNSTKAAYVKSLRHPVMKTYSTHMKMKGPKSPFVSQLNKDKPVFSENEIKTLESILKGLGE